MAMVDVNGSNLKADSQPMFPGLVWFFGGYLADSLHYLMKRVNLLKDYDRYTSNMKIESGITTTTTNTNTTTTTTIDPL